MTTELIAQFDRLIRRDPARRGLISSEAKFGPLCPGHLLAAATHLAENGKTVGIVTGFFVPGGDVPAAETDGPLGSVLLAATLKSLGMTPFVITDSKCSSALAAALEAVGLPAELLIVASDDIENALPEFFARYFCRSLSHLIAVERVGPAHTPESLDNVEHSEKFRETVPRDSHGRCHNMRGEKIDEHTSALHLLFEQVDVRFPNAKTIGIGDGGNEIGMGAVSWFDLARRLTGDMSARIPCRVPTDWNIVAGTSNWGAYALAAAVAVLRDGVAVQSPWDLDWQQRALESIVRRGPAVDGVTRRREATIDGLPFVTYFQPLLEVRRRMGLEK